MKTEHECSERFANPGGTVMIGEECCTSTHQHRNLKNQCNASLSDMPMSPDVVRGRKVGYMVGRHVFTLILIDVSTT
jgi:hypothetical protein